MLETGVSFRYRVAKKHRLTIGEVDVILAGKRVSVLVTADIEPTGRTLTLTLVDVALQGFHRGRSLKD